MRSRLLLVPALAIALLGCSQAQDAVDSARDGVSSARDTAGKVQDCAGLVRDVAGFGLSNSPSVADAERAKQRLDERVEDIGDQGVREAAQNLSTKVGELITVLRSADRSQLSVKVSQTRAAAEQAAGACNLPLSRFLS